MFKKNIFSKREKSKLFVIFFILIFVIFLSFFSSAILEDREYNEGEEIKLDFSNYNNYSLKILTPSNTLIKEGNRDIFLFKLEEPGEYTFEVNNLEKYIIQVLNKSSEEIISKKSEDEISFVEEKNIQQIIEDPKIVVGESVKQKKEIFVGNSNKIKIESPFLGENLTVSNNGKDVDFEIEQSFYNKIISIISEEYVEKEIVLEGIQGKIILEYETPAPEKKEKEISKTKKEVVVYASDKLGYKNVYSSTEINEIVNDKNKIKIYWKEENKYLDFNVSDKDKDGFFDEVSWIVPHLSTQTFEIILVTKAEYLSFNKTFIKDIYEEISEKDNDWFYAEDENFIRVNFEKNLTKNNDITVYAKSNDSNSKIEIYQKNSLVKIAEILNIKEEGFYKVFLKDLIGIEDTFDLRIFGNILIDLIIDPTITNSPTLFIDTNNKWSGETGGYADGGGSTSTTSSDKTLLYYNYSFGIPAGSTIDQVRVRTDYYVTTSNEWMIVEVSWDGGSTWGTVHTLPHHSSETTDWTNITSDTTWTVDKLNDSNFRVRLTPKKTGASGTWYVDWVPVEVIYTSSPPPGEVYVNLDFPNDNSLSGTKFVEFNYTPTTEGAFVNCSLWDNSSGTFAYRKVNETLITNSTSNLINYTYSSDGYYFWSIKCYDDTSNNFAGENYTLTIDTTKPTVNSLTPYNDSTSSSLYGVDFVYNVSDANLIDNCSLILDGNSVLNDNSIARNINQTLSYPVESGIHTWAISCIDSAGNSEISENKTINVSFSPQTFDRRWYETSTSNYTSTADIFLTNTRDSEENEMSYTLSSNSLYTLTESVSPFMVNNGALIGSGTVDFSGYFTTSSSNKIYITWKIYVTNSSGDTLICQYGDDSTGGGTPLSAAETFTGSCNNPSDIYLSPTDRIKLIVNAWNDHTQSVDVTHFWDGLRLSYAEFNTFSSLGDLSVDMTYPTNDLNINTNQYFDITCFTNCSAGDCLNTNVYVQQNTSGNGWSNIGASGNLILSGSETNPHDLGSVNVSSNSTNFTIKGNLESVNNVRCIAESTYSNSTGTTTKQVTVSGVNSAPQVFLEDPGNTSWEASTVLDLIYNVSDVDSNLESCNLYLDGIFNQTNQTILTNYQFNNFTLSGLTQGTHNWSVNCTDDLAASNVSETREFYVDSIFPTFDLIFPSEDDVSSVNDIIFNFTVEDNLDSSLLCNLTIDGIVEDENFNANNGSYIERPIYDLTIQDHLWNVTCEDNAGNINTSLTYNFSVIDLNPVVYLVDPFNETWVDSTTQILIYNVSENNDLESCNLYLDGVFNQTNQTTLINGGDNNFTVSGLNQGIHNWFVNCTDDNSLIGLSDIWEFYVDSIFPIFELNAPENYFNSSEGDSNFNFTVEDNLDSSLICNLTINSIVVDENFAVSNKTLTNKAVLNVQDGLNYWNVTCQDDASNTNTSETRILNVTEIPSVLLQTEDNSAFNYTPFNLEYLPNDNMNFQSCELYINGILDQTNSSIITKGITNTFSLNPSSGNYNWSVKCIDEFGLSNQTENRSFLVDFISPQLTSHYPENGDTIYESKVDFNFTISDNFDSFIDCDLRVDNVVENSSSFFNDTVGVLSHTFSSGGIKFWNVTCHDDAGNYNYSETKNFTIYIPPTIYLISPQNQSWESNNSLTFVYNISDGNNDLKNSTFILDGNYNNTNSSILINEGNNNFTISGISEGIHNWTVEVYDNENLLGTSGIFFVNVDRTEPFVGINSPQDDEIVDTNNVTLNFTLSDNFDSNFICNISDTEGFNYFEEETFYSGENIRYLSRSDGDYLWDVSCIDSAGNNNITSTYNFSVVAPPVVNLNSPDNDFWTTDASYQFNYTPVDAIGLTSCTFYWDGQINETDINIEKNIPNLFTYPSISEGKHNWSVECTDADLNSVMSETRILYRDLTAPSIILEEPDNDTGIYNDGSNVIFRWRGIDNLDSIFTCDLYVDELVEKNDVLVSNNISNGESVSGLEDGIHNWSVTCWDELNNLNSSETRFFDLDVPDFVANNLTANLSSPQEDDSILISANISNVGGVSVENVLVSLNKEGISIQNLTVNLSEGENTILNFSWTAEIGLNQFSVEIDPENETIESNYLNNEYFLNVSIGSWHSFYGSINSDSEFILGNDSDLISWSSGNFNKGNIFVTDSESLISWNDLISLGRDKNSLASYDDFGELDSILGIENFQDSISSLYLVGGVPENLTNILAFKNQISNVPIEVSINSSNFTTGILWDSSDSLDDEFDSTEKEDVVFISEINRGKLGSYDLVDYEIRVPAYLREYDPTNSDEAIFYAELY